MTHQSPSLEKLLETVASHLNSSSFIAYIISLIDFFIGAPHGTVMSPTDVTKRGADSHSSLRRAAQFVSAAQTFNYEVANYDSSIS